MKAISLDIETLDTTSSAVVLSIGACVVTPDGCRDSFYTRVSISEQLGLGRTISEGALRFWLARPADVQKSTFGDNEGSPVTAALKALALWVRRQGADVGVYCKGPQFDAAILDSLADAAGCQRPVHYKQWRDVRTLEDLITWAGFSRDLRDAKGKELCSHDALADAYDQGEVVRLAMVLTAGKEKTNVAA